MFSVSGVGILQLLIVQLLTSTQIQPPTMPRPKRSVGHKERKHKIYWSKNPEWSEALAAILADDQAIRNG